MSRRAYGQFCGLSRALEIVGERWALLIIRDLLSSPKRFTDLRNGLPKIPTNILSSRLKELEQNGIVTRTVLPRPDGSIVYQLTETGAQLDGIVLAMGRWGAQFLGEPRPGEIVTVDSLINALRATFRGERSRGVHLSYQIHVGEIAVHLHVDDGELHAVAGERPDADLVIRTGPALRALMAGELSPADALNGGCATVTGDPDLLDRFVDLFHIPGAVPTHIG